MRNDLPLLLVLSMNRKVNRERNRNGSSMSYSGGNYPSGAEETAHPRAHQRHGKKRVTRE